MKKRLALAAAFAVFLLHPIRGLATDLPLDGSGDGTVSGNNSISEDQVIEIPGWGVITQQDIEELAGVTRDATGEYLSQNSDQPLKIVREPDTVLTYKEGYGTYRYTLPDGQWIECNAPQGAFYRGSVEFNTSESMTAVVHYKDGIAEAGKGPFVENGSYIVTFWDLNVDGDANYAYRLDYCFTIYSDFRMNLSHIEAPGGMEVAEVLYEGVAQEPEQKRYVQARKDGHYHIVFSSPACSYEMDYLRDTTPPVIEFTPEYRLNKAMDCEVEYRIPEEGVKLTTYRNSSQVVLPQGSVPVNGAYRFVVADAVGNERVYSFYVRTPVKMFTKKMLLIPAGLLLAAVLVALHSRRNMRVL